MRSIFDDTGTVGCFGQYNGCQYDTIPSPWLADAWGQAIFWDVPALKADGSPEFSDVVQFMANGGIVRSSEAYIHPRQQTYIDNGYQRIVTDYPWHFVNDRGPAGLPTDPSRRFFVPGWSVDRADALIEPGNRIYVQNQIASFLYSLVPTSGFRFWEATVSTTRRGDYWEATPDLVFARPARDDGNGCIRAAASQSDYVAVCRSKHTDGSDAHDQEQIVIHVLTAHAGVPRMLRFVADVHHTDTIGNLIGLAVNNGPEGASVGAFSAGRLAAEGQPAWRRLLDDRFPMPLTAQGLVSAADVLFAGPRIKEDGAALRPVTLCDPRSAIRSSGPASKQTCRISRSPARRRFARRPRGPCRSEPPS